MIGHIDTGIRGRPVPGGPSRGDVDTAYIGSITRALIQQQWRLPIMLPDAV